jgi:hypothetical protein
VAPAALAPARKLLQGRLNTSPSARQQYEAAEVVVMVYITSESIITAQVGFCACCTLFPLSHDHLEGV